MILATSKSRHPEETKRKLVEATLQLMIQQGFAATSVDQICAEAKLTKGSFFHHFDNKEAIGRAAVEAWGEFGGNLYAEAWKDPNLDPLDQLHRFFDIMIGFNERNQPCLCMVGMMSQEMALKNPMMRVACERQLQIWSDMVVRMLTAAKKLHLPVIPFDPEQVAWFLNSLWQGSMLIGKTRQRPEMTIANLHHARAYVDSLFGIQYSTHDLMVAST
jgi:TetR/AcrR family transcriptional repressor of nem operon